MTSVRSTIAAGLALGSAALGASIASAQTVPNQYRGNVCIVATTPACAPAGWAVSNCGNARFVPPNWAGGPNTTRLSIFWNYFAQNYTATGSLVGAALRPVQSGGIGNSFSSHARSTARITAQAPAAPTNATVFLSHTMIVTRFDDVPGCNVTLRFQGQRYPLP